MAHIPFLLARGTAAALANYAGPQGEITVDTTNNTLIVQTGAAGGERLAKFSDLPSLATSTVAGLMSAADKANLDALVERPSGGSVVEYTPTLMVGTEVGTLTIDGEVERIYAPIYAEATTTVSGLMSTADKSKLDAIQQNATATTFTQTLTSGTEIGKITVNGTSTSVYAPQISAAADTTTGVKIGSITIGSNTVSFYSAGKQMVYANTDANADYLLVHATTNDTTSSDVTNITKTGGLTYNPSTDTLKTPNLVVSTSISAPAATTSAAGLMSAADKTKLDGLIGLTSGTATAGSTGPAANATLAFSGTFTVPQITVDEYGRVTSVTARTMTMPANPDTNTHYKATPILGASSATSNATSATSNTATYLNIIENSAKSGGVQIKGSGSVTVSAVNGVLTITGTDTNTTYSGTSPISISGTSISHATSGVTAGSYGPSANASPAHSGTFSVPYITVDNKGHVTACSTKTITLPADSNTDTNVTQTVTTTNSKYPVLFKYSTATSTVTAGARFGSTITANPSTGYLFTNTPATSTNDTTVATTAFVRSAISSYAPAGTSYTAGTGISISSSKISVNSTVVVTSGAQTIAGNKTFTGTSAFTNPIYGYSSSAETGIGFFHTSSMPANGYTNKVAGFQGHYSSSYDAAAMYVYRPGSTATTNAHENFFVLRDDGSKIQWRFGSRCYTSVTTNAVIPEFNKINLGGSSSNSWANIYAVNTTVRSSDERTKTDIAAIPDSLLDIWENIPWVQFRWKEKVEQGDSGARLHMGSVAQRIEKIFSDAGDDATKYSFFCYDKWDAEEPEYDNNGQLMFAGKEAGDAYALRYEDMLCIEAAYQRRRADRLEAALAELEQRVVELEKKSS